MESLYAHYPGLIVVTPATVADAYSMLIDSIKLDDPVIYCEHKFLYRWLKSSSYEGDRLPIGKARVARAGKHATVVTYSAMVHEAVRAAEMLHMQGGWEIEVVDLRSVKPLDTDTIIASVARTGRLLAVGEAFPWGGVTAEVVSRVSADGFHLLDAPPARLNARDTPIPYHPKLWAAHRPTPESIAHALHKLLNY
jgi:pyruvate dehydrogenase E1 component beta subunit/2-oxoisovalerate dehydrogenase E1 component beta subunit